MAHRMLKPAGYSVLLGKGLVEAFAYLTVLPLLCGDVETCGLGADMQLLMSGSAGTCVGEDGNLCRWVHDVKALDVWGPGGGSGSAAGRRLARATAASYGAAIEVANAADATQATMATAAVPGYKGVPRVMAVFSSSHFDERMWEAAVGPKGVTVPIVKMAPYIWCVLLLLSLSIVIVIIIIMTITITIIIVTTYYSNYAWRLPPSSPARCPASHMPACRHFTSHAAYASNPWQKKLSGKLESMVRVYCPKGAVVAGGVLQPPQHWNTELQDAQNLIPAAPGAPGVLQQLQGKRTTTCMQALFSYTFLSVFPHRP
jgi:hypothetical protein